VAQAIPFSGMDTQLRKDSQKPPVLNGTGLTQPVRQPVTHDGAVLPGRSRTDRPREAVSWGTVLGRLEEEAAEPQPSTPLLWPAMC